MQKALIPEGPCVTSVWTATPIALTEHIGTAGHSTGPVRDQKLVPSAPASGDKNSAFVMKASTNFPMCLSSRYGIDGCESNILPGGCILNGITITLCGILRGTTRMHITTCSSVRAAFMISKFAAESHACRVC